MCIYIYIYTYVSGLRDVVRAGAPDERGAAAGA